MSAKSLSISWSVPSCMRSYRLRSHCKVHPSVRLTVASIDRYCPAVAMPSLIPMSTTISTTPSTTVLNVGQSSSEGLTDTSNGEW